MRAGEIRVRVGVAGLVAREFGRRSMASLKTVARFASRPIEPGPDQIVIAPQDIRTADPTVADDIHAGRFVFSGQMAEARDGSPFQLVPPSPEWERMLQGFGWLRHLRAAETASAREDARHLLEDWMRNGTGSPVAWEADVAARRLLSLLAQAPMLLDGCDAAFYRRFLQLIGTHARRLRHRFDEAPPGPGRLRAATALLAVAVAVQNFRRDIKPAIRRLDEELAAQIHPDGGHIGRSPATILEILTDLLPVRQAQAARGIPVSQGAMNAVDRMMHLLRFFRHGDGALAHFNGTGVTPLSLMATVLVYDDSRGRPPGNAPYSAYQRLEADRTVVIVDCGAPPPPLLAREAHAGPLAFEMSSGRNRFIVNCGAPQRASDSWRAIARTTAAHSTLTVADASAGLLASEALARLVGPVLLAGPKVVTVDRQEHDGDVAVIASHDAWAEPFGFVHERTLRLNRTGGRLDGRDRLIAVSEAAGRATPFSIRFHLHPSIRPTALAGGPVMLTAPDGETWEFHVDGAVPVVEESVYLADLHGARRTWQIAIHGKGPAEIRWTALRAVEPNGTRRRG